MTIFRMSTLRLDGQKQTFGKGEADISVCSVIGKCELGSISYDVGISEYVH